MPYYRRYHVVTALVLSESRLRTASNLPFASLQSMKRANHTKRELTPSHIWKSSMDRILRSVKVLLSSESYPLAPTGTKFRVILLHHKTVRLSINNFSLRQPCVLTRKDKNLLFLHRFSATFLSFSSTRTSSSCHNSMRSRLWIQS
jgi:hypothetical protein